MMPTVKELRKAGQLSEAYELASQNLEANPENIWDKRAIGWVLYEYLKQNTNYQNKERFQQYFQELLNLELSDEETMLYDNSCWQIVKALFDTAKQENPDLNYIEQLITYCHQISYSIPSDIHSAILKAMLKVQDKYPKFLEFIDWWDLGNLQNSDYQKETFNEREIMSVAERTYIAVSKKHLLGKINENSPNPFYPERILDKEAIEEFLPKLDRLIENHPEFLYPPYFKAKLMLSIGEKENVLKTFLPFARKKSRDFWMWQVLAETFSGEIEMQIACYCKALSCKSTETFLLKIREGLAKILINNNLYGEAKTEIERIIKTREKEGWKISNTIIDWQKQPWYSETQAKPDNRNYYRKHISVAEEILYSDIEPDIGVIDFVNREGGIAYFIVSKTITGNFKFNKNEPPLKLGDFVELRLKNVTGNSGSYYKVLTVKPTSKEPSPEIFTNFHGRLVLKTDRKGNHFGFVNDIFVPPDILKSKNLQNAVSITIDGTAMLNFNKSKGIWGWKAIKLK